MLQPDMPVWDGIHDLLKAGLDEKQIRRLLFLRRWNREHGHFHFHDLKSGHASEEDLVGQVEAAMEAENAPRQ